MDDTAPAGPPAGIPDALTGPAVHQDLVASPTANGGLASQVPPDLQAQPPSPGPVNFLTAMQTPPDLTMDQVTSRNWLANPPGLPDSVKQVLTDPNPMMDDFAKAGSAVGKGMSILGKPANLLAASVIKAASILGVPGGKELEAKLNPEHRWFPDAFISDVMDFYDDKYNPVAQAVARGDMSSQSTGQKVMYYASRAALGLYANVETDPLNLLNAATYTKAASELRKVGSAVDEAGNMAIASKAAQEKNLLTIRAPFSSAELPILGPKAYDLVAQNPAVKQVASLLRELSPDTGYADVDLASSNHADLLRGNAQTVMSKWVMPNNARKFSEAEQDVITKLVEATPNLKPNIPESVIAAAGGKLSGEENAVRARMGELVSKMPDIVPGRPEQLVDAAMDVKKMGSAQIEALHRGGWLNEENVGQKVLENYMPHVVDPNYRGYRFVGAGGKVKSAEQVQSEIASRLQSIESKATQVVKGSYLSPTDPTRYRSLSRGMSLSEASQAVRDQYGIKDFYVKNPVHAAAIRLLEAGKAEQDSRLVDTIARYGIRPRPGQVPPQGYAPIPIPKFEGKTIVLKDADGSARTVHFKDTLFPKDIASKMSYYLNPPAVSNIAANMKAMNSIFRSTSFVSPGFWGRNVADNAVKAHVQGVSLETWLDTLKLAAGKLTGVQTEGNALSPARYVGARELQDTMAKFGVGAGNAFQEGVKDFMAAGKRLTLSQAMSSPRQLGLQYTAQAAQAMLHGISQFGERGEGFTRKALWLQRFKEGYTPEMAAREVTKYLFDYTRNSPATDALRFYLPFIQHPIKTALVAPELLGKSPATYDTLHNTLPHVMAKAFHDPISQDELNQLLPDNLRARDAIVGPLFTGNTMLAHAFLNRTGKQPFQTNMGGAAYFDPAIGMRILEHFNVFSKASAQNNWGLAPVFGSALRAITGQDQFGRSLDEATVSRPDWGNRFSYFVRSTLEGTFAFHNAWNLIQQAYGIKDPNLAEPATVTMMRGAMGQFGGVTDLDRDFFFRTIALSHERADLVKNLHTAVAREVRGFPQPGSVASYVKDKFGDILPEAPQKTWENLQQNLAVNSGRQAAAQAVQGQISSADYAARIKAIDQSLRDNQAAYRFGIGRYLEMARGAKNSADARAKAGVGH